MPINKIAVIGSGVMGSGIAAQVANAGFNCVLLDIVPKAARQRNQLAENAVAQQIKAGGFMSQAAAGRIETGNLEDNLDSIADADWIIEAIIENLDIKQDLYRRIDAVRKPGSIVSSNTSTIPLKLLIADQSAALQQDFIITHFFNPPRHMRLLELVSVEKTRPGALQQVKDFADVHLGKGIVICKDTPGFIANRIGIFWLQKALLSAFENGISVEQADAVLGRPMGIPKTGVFGLWDLIGIDLGPHLIKSMTSTLRADDPLQPLAHLPQQVLDMIDKGYTGRKGKGGFYRMKKEDGKKMLEGLDLATGKYRPTIPADLGALLSSSEGLRGLLENDHPVADYAWDVLSNVLCYSASLVPEICDQIDDIDETMRLGYNWRFGPFELIDQLGANWFCQRLQQENRPIPPLLQQLGERRFYQVENGVKQQFAIDGEYHPIHRPEGVLLLSDLKLRQQPVVHNDAASLWDIGDGVACLEFHTKMNAVDKGIIDMIRQSIDTVSERFSALVLYNEGQAFSAGANLAAMKDNIEQQNWQAIADFVAYGQQTYQQLQSAPFPVVGAPAGMALGGGCEVLLHCDAIQAHAETYTGLVEISVGLVPAWGGCKEMLKRLSARHGREKGTQQAFLQIVTAQVSKSADDAREMGILDINDRITMNRSRLLADAKSFALELAQDYQPAAPALIASCGADFRDQLMTQVKGWVSAGKASAHDQRIAGRVAAILCTDSTSEIEPQTLLQQEQDAINALLRESATQARIHHLLQTGKPLRN